MYFHSSQASDLKAEQVKISQFLKFDWRIDVLSLLAYFCLKNLKN
jgi:hypothetical protein